MTDAKHEAPADDGPVFHMNLLSHEDNEAWLESARRVAAKHEAPAEGAGEALGAAENLHAAAMIYEDRALLDDAEIVLKHLRARSSAPEAREGEAVERKADGLAHLVAAISLLKRAEEIGKKPSMATGSKKMFDQMLRDYEGAANRMRKAIYTHPAREEALGNLLAVIHGDGGHRALEVGTKQAALEAEKIVAGLFAAPSADKLRTAVEAIWEIAGGRAAEGHNETGRLARIKDRASEALAALKAEQKGGA